MIKFLRSIRKRLIREKKLGNYFVYAIGEIVLVVIGILIALAINTSNQTKIDREKEQTYLIGLRKEFQTSRLKLHELIKVNRQNYEGARKLMEFKSDESTRPSEKQFSELLFATFSNDISFNPNNSLLVEMINSGSLKDLSNAELRVHLTNWIATLSDIANQERALGVEREKVLEMFRTNKNSIRTIFDLTNESEKLGLKKAENTISNLELLNSIEFENNVLMFMITSYATETTHYTPLLEDLNAVLKLIEAEIR